jgi:hypothetical protein
MFDIAKLTGLVGDLLGNTLQRPGIDALTEQLGALGIDPQIFEGMDAQQILETLEGQGFDLSGIDPNELLALGSETDLNSIMPDIIDRITDRAA